MHPGRIPLIQSLFRFSEAADGPYGRKRAWLFIFAAALLLTLSLQFFEFETVEAVFYDARVRLKPHPQGSSQIQLVVFDENDLKQQGQLNNAHLVQNLLNSVLSAQPLGVAIELPLKDLFEQDPHGRIDIENLSAPTYWLTSEFVATGAGKDYILQNRLPKVRIQPGPISVDRNNFARDGVTRRALLSYRDEPTGQYLLAQILNPSISQAQDRGEFEFIDSEQVYINFSKPESYARISWTQALKDPSALAQKIVIIGKDLKSNPQDYIRTPMSRDAVAMTTVEANAHIIQTMASLSSPVRISGYVRPLLIFFVSTLAIAALFFLRPAFGLTSLLLLAAVLFGTSTLALWWFKLWIPLAHPFIAIIIGYYFFIPYRLILESRRSEAYIRENEVLSQVEELKTNFLRMVSHDLRTPLARIRGAAEVVRQTLPDSNLKASEALKTLDASSEELLSMISSLLDVSRIESGGIQSNFQSHDPNRVIEMSVQQSEWLAANKKITIVQELEPLFSIKMDATLIRQVLTNLIENAIKYSPEGSKILVSSDEEDGMVKIQIADQGAGIEDHEISNIFLKFYRSEKARESSVKGSGLGLYLANYFIKLHRGRIRAESKLGQGSTFTVELPIS